MNTLNNSELALNTYHYFPGEQNICLSCGKHFSRRDAMLVHFRDIHQNAGKTFVCELCNKTCLMKSIYENFRPVDAVLIGLIKLL